MDQTQPAPTNDWRPERIFRVELSPRWVSVEFGGQTIAASKQPLLVWDHHFIPVYFFPRGDVLVDALRPTGNRRGERTTYHVAVDGHEATNAAWSYTDPGEQREPLRDYVTFRWDKMDAWYEEEEQVFVHARNPYSRVDTIASSRQIKMVANEVVVAETRQPYLLFETHLPTRYYIQPDDVNRGLLVASDTRTSCPYKGDAVYWSIQAGDSFLKDVVWSYPDPIPEAPKLKNLLAFYNEKLDIYVDGELEAKPETVWA